MRDDFPLGNFPWPYRTDVHNPFSVEIARKQLAVEVTRPNRAAIMVDMTIPLAELPAGCHGAADELESLYGLALGTLGNYVDWIWRKTNFAGDFPPGRWGRPVPLLSIVSFTSIVASRKRLPILYARIVVHRDVQLFRFRAYSSSPKPILVLLSSQ